MSINHPNHNTLKVTFVNPIGDTLNITAPSLGIAYDTAHKIGFEIYDYEMMEGEEFSAAY
jgi:hypothetical protein